MSKLQNEVNESISMNVGLPIEVIKSMPILDMKDYLEKKNKKEIKAAHFPRKFIVDIDNILYKPNWLIRLFNRLFRRAKYEQ
jgi:hypothetical protein